MKILITTDKYSKLTPGKVYTAKPYPNNGWIGCVEVMKDDGSSTYIIGGILEVDGVVRENDSGEYVVIYDNPVVGI